MATAVTYPTGALREALERTASDPGTPAASKQRELRTIRDELKHLAGYADSLLGELALAEEREALDAQQEELRLHEDAAIREEMLRRGLATEEQLDQLGLTSSGELAERRADGTLAEAVSAADFLPSLHPRGRTGRWIDAPERLVRRGEFERGQLVHWERDGETFGGTVVEPPDADGYATLDVGGVSVAVQAARLRHGAVPPGRDARRPVPRTPEAEPDLPESMPRPRPEDPFIEAGLPPLVADGLRATEPPFIAGLPSSSREPMERIQGEKVARDRSEWDELSRIARDRWSHWRESGDADRSTWTRPDGLTYSPEVEAIGSPADAEAFLATRGVEARLTPPDTEQGRNLAADTDFFRQIAQAVADAQDRTPGIASGPHPLKRVSLWSNTEQARRGPIGTAAVQDAVWAQTGIALDDPDVNTAMHAVPASEDDPEAADPRRWEGQPSVVIISDINQYGLQARGELEGQETSYADWTPYGRMTHELGHVAFAASGAEDEGIRRDQDPALLETEWLTDEALGPDSLYEVSPYAATNAGEAWAETYATLHVPGALERLRERQPRLAGRLERMRETANAKGWGEIL